MLIDLEDQSCLDCRLFISDGSKNAKGECHRHAPRLLDHSGFSTKFKEGQWPTVMTVDWCGEFQEKPNEPS
jgi:hypothetical protein